MEGTVRRKLELKASPTKTWKVYGSLKLADIAVETFPNKYKGYKLLQGDGNAGTIIQVFFAKGVPGPPWYKEEFLVVDDVKRVKIGKFIEGGVLDQGFKSYVVVLNAIEKEGAKDECIMKGTIEYMLNDIAALPLVEQSIEGLYEIMKAVADYVINHNNNKSLNSQT
ncbi:hypothetical protein Salat_0777600 [Sesamum alatum]|uniref:Bet v I/Major latex protein domain-containing protein n=1 Tax=Sesamum alatum TaxID=300844 RepID=A0AAE1YTE5_9LAMI|nr:hypothetical protein Salat_0777600 [Sesamum alatum]